MVRVIVLIIVVAGLASAGPLARADFAAGAAAYERSDYRTAMKELLRSAENGNPEAQFLVANMYDRGQGVRKDSGEAMQWYFKAARHGYAPAMYRVGRSVVWYLRMDADQIEAQVVDVLMQNPKFGKDGSKQSERDIRRYLSMRKILATAALLAAAAQGDKTALMEKREVISRLSEKELNAASVRARNLDDGDMWLRAILE